MLRDGLKALLWLWAPLPVERQAESNHRMVSDLCTAVPAIKIFQAQAAIGPEQKEHLLEIRLFDRDILKYIQQLLVASFTKGLNFHRQALQVVITILKCVKRPQLLILIVGSDPLVIHQ